MNIIVIPARAGSKGIKNKNLQEIEGTSLVKRAALNASDSIADLIFVSTDSPTIAEEVSRVPRVKIHMRSAQTSSDEASTESVIEELVKDFSEVIHPKDKIAIIQVTSPFTSIDTINKSFTSTELGVSTVGVIESIQFRWKRQKRGYCKPTNHSKNFRPRRQDIQPELIETGGCYVFTVEDFLINKSRFSKKVIPIIQSEPESLDIDTQDELNLARSIASKNSSIYINQKKNIKKPKLIFTDFDGCLTDDLATLNELGEESVRVSRKDGASIGRLIGNGIQVVIISSEENPVVNKRAQKLKIVSIQGVKNKLEIAKKILLDTGFDETDAWFVGNDINDLEPVKYFFSLCPRDAVDEIKNHSDIILKTHGGAGIFAEISRLIYESE